MIFAFCWYSPYKDKICIIKSHAWIHLDVKLSASIFWLTDIKIKKPNIVCMLPNDILDNDRLYTPRWPCKIAMEWKYCIDWWCRSHYVRNYSWMYDDSGVNNPIALAEIWKVQYVIQLCMVHNSWWKWIWFM